MSPFPSFSVCVSCLCRWWANVGLNMRLHKRLMLAESCRQSWDNLYSIRIYLCIQLFKWRSFCKIKAQYCTHSFFIHYMGRKTKIIFIVQVARFLPVFVIWDTFPVFALAFLSEVASSKWPTHCSHTCLVFITWLIFRLCGETLCGETLIKIVLIKGQQQQNFADVLMRYLGMDKQLKSCCLKTVFIGSILRGCSKG